MCLMWDSSVGMERCNVKWVDAISHSVKCCSTKLGPHKLQCKIPFMMVVTHAFGPIRLVTSAWGHSIPPPFFSNWFHLLLVALVSKETVAQALNNGVSYIPIWRSFNPSYWLWYGVKLFLSVTSLALNRCLSKPMDECFWGSVFHDDIICMPHIAKLY